MNKKIRKILSTILISVSSISFWEAGKKYYMYIDNRISYNKMMAVVNEADSVQEYLDGKPYEWIEVSDTAISYPLVKGEDNQYYLNHDFEGNPNKAGSIYYDALDETYNGLLTVIYGHSMRDGSYFNNLHYFPKDVERFKNTRLTITTNEGVKVYKPLGYTIYDGSNPFYRKIDDMDIYTAMRTLKEECDYINDVTVYDDSHIIALVTCDYSRDNGRIAVFYVSE